MTFDFVDDLDPDMIVSFAWTLHTQGSGAFG